MMATLVLFGVLHWLPGGWQLATLMLAMGVLGYVGWAFWIAHCSQLADLAPTSVPVAISLNLTAFNLGIAVAAAMGGVVVDWLGSEALALAAAPFAVLTLPLAALMGRGVPRSGAPVEATPTPDQA